MLHIHGTFSGSLTDSDKNVLKSHSWKSKAGFSFCSKAALAGRVELQRAHSNFSGLKCEKKVRTVFQEHGTIKGWSKKARCMWFTQISLSPQCLLVLFRLPPDRRTPIIYHLQTDKHLILGVYFCLTEVSRALCVHIRMGILVQLQQ